MTTQHTKRSNLDLDLDRERGAVTAMVIVIVAIAMSAVALVYDLGMAAVARSEVADAAATLARAGATQLGRDSSGEQIETGEAFERMELLADERWPHLDWSAAVGADAVTVTVTVTGRYEAVFMDAFGWDGADLELTHSAVTRR